VAPLGQPDHSDRLLTSLICIGVLQRPMHHGHRQDGVDQYQSRESAAGAHCTPWVSLVHDNSVTMTAPSLQISILALALASCAPARSEKARTPNVVIVSIDTLRGDQLGRAGPDGASLTPVLDALAAESVQFSAAFSQSNETLFSHASMFTGRYPSELGALDYMSYRIAPGTPTIASRLADAGYRTEAVVGGGHMAPAFGMQAGFHRYRSTSDFSGFQETMPIALQTLDELAAEEQPFLLFVHGYDCHTPYIKPGPFGRPMSPGHESDLVDLARQPLTYDRIWKDKLYPEFEAPQISSPDALRFLDPEVFADLETYAAGPGAQTHRVLSGAEQKFLLGTYDAATQYADTFVGFLLDRIDEEELRDNTVLIVLSDHGEDLLDNGFFNHRVTLQDPNIRVPLIVRAPGVQPEIRRDLVGLIDVLPTILQATGLPARPSPGHSLLLPPTEKDRGIFSESLRGQISVRSSRGRLIVPRALARPDSAPESQPEGVKIYGPNGRASSWASPRSGDLWIQLNQVDAL
jgi:arylsulfatase A-like enzyme